MRVKLAKRTGFCFGVKRAVSMAEDALKNNRRAICSLGSIIHNREVVEDLSKKGLRVVGDIRDISEGAVVISSHGLSPKIASRLAKKGLEIIDTTCPFVLKAQDIARRLSDEGYTVLIVGDANHPEVKALVDFVPKKAFVVKDKFEAASLKLKKNERLSIISQTTQSTGNFRDCIKAIRKLGPKEIKIFNTICNDAEERQKDARALARKVDLMLVVGGRHSANTKRLLEVCRPILKKTHLVETEKDLKEGWFKRGRAIGIASGASTPDWIIQKITKAINSKSKERGCAANG